MTLVLAVVLGTAILHASWNVLAKSVGDQWVSSALIGVVNGVFGLCCIAVFGVPIFAAWPFLIVSSALQSLYLVVLTHSYAHGEMSRLYPIARGTSPVVVTILAVTLMHEQLSFLSWLGLFLLVAGIAVLAFAPRMPTRAGSTSRRGLGLAVLTGLIIASYTFADGMGVRAASENPFAYIGWMFFLQAPLLLVLCRWRAGSQLWHRMRIHAVPGLSGGVLSVTSYGLVVWAQSKAPLALVSGLRETSVVWAVLLGRLFLKEKLGTREVLAIAAAAAGACLLQLGA